MNKNYNIELNEEDQEDTKKESFSLNILDREEKNDEPSSKPIHKSMIISEVVDTHPDVVPILIESGMHCIGCGASMFETLEEGLMGHGMDDREVDRVIDNLNDHIKKKPKIINDDE
jgi:hybrid cluster-associated redox disulfide protein